MFIYYSIIMKKLVFLLLPFLLVGSFVFAYTSQEQKEAYDWAYSKGITTQPIEKANLNWYITRQALAKMLVKFHEARYGETVHISDPKACNFADKDKITEDLKEYVHAACEFEYMWVWTKYFNPMWNVTRAQFGTTLSRLLYWSNFDGWTPYYQKHLDYLKKKWIMENISNPNINEKRGDIMVMLKNANDELNNEIEWLIQGGSDPLNKLIQELK